MTRDMAELEHLEAQDLQAPEVTPLLALQALRGLLVHQEEAMMGNLDHRAPLDLQGPA